MGLLLRFLLKSAYRHITMVYEKFIEVGAVVYITLGHHKGKIAAIANVIDQNRVLVDGPCSGVPRCVVNLKQMQLTKFKLTFLLAIVLVVSKRYGRRKTSMLNGLQLLGRKRSNQRLERHNSQTLTDSSS